MRRVSLVVSIIMLVVMLCTTANSQRDRIRRPEPSSSFGVAITEVPPGSAVKGAYVQKVLPGSPAEAAGILEGDIITRFDTDDIISPILLMRILAISSRQASHEIVVMRGGNQITLTSSGASGGSNGGSSLGFGLATVPAQWGVKGALVQDVVAGSPADAAGVMVGDIITELGGTSVTGVGQVPSIVASLPKGRLSSMSIWRGDKTSTLYVMPQDKPAGESSPQISINRSATDINVLKYALVDPTTRTVTLIGKYDSNYPTGPIPYYDLLNDAMKSPYASFSLEPTDATVKSIDTVQRSIQKDVDRMESDLSYCNEFAARLLNLVTNDASLMKDQENFKRKLADAFGISPADASEMMRLMRGEDLGDQTGPMLANAMRGIGLKDIGTALDLFTKGDADSINQAFDLLNIRSQIDSLRASYQAGQKTGEQASAECQMYFWSALLRGLGIPEAEITSHGNQLLNGQITLASYIEYAGGKLTASLTDTVGLKLFNMLTLSDDLLAKLYLIQTPKMNLVFSNVPGDSVLGDTLFRADFMLKTICTSQELRTRVPEHLTSQEFLYQDSVKKGINTSNIGAQVGHRLVPGEVKMKVSPDGTVVAFGDAQVKVIGWLIKDESGKRANSKASQFIKDDINDYASYLTSHYESYAKSIPELHRMREAAKLVALARWAKANNYNLVVDKAYNLKSAPPSTTTGFWQAVFTADKQQFSLSIVAEGGASFGQDEGEAWVKPAVDATVTNDVYKQLAFSSVFARDAAVAAIDGDMESARDLAEKSARAMTGDIDLTQLPQLADMPSFTGPATEAQLASEALLATEDSLKALDAAKITMATADTIQNTSPAEAQALRDSAAKAQQEANEKLQKLRDAMNEAQQSSTSRAGALVSIRNLNSKPVMIAGLVTSTGAAVTTASGSSAVDATPTTQAATEVLDIPRSQRQKWVLELEKVQAEMATTKAQLLKLNKSILSDQQQYQMWQNEAQSGMEKCRDVYFDLFMDAAVGGLQDRYDTMYDLANKLPNKPVDLINRYGRTAAELEALSGAKTWKDLIEWAGKDANTLPEALEKVRDGVTQILSVTALDKTPPGAVWKYGCSIVDMTYSFAQFCTAWDGVMQMDQNNESYQKALAALTARMQKLMERSKELQGNLAVPSAGR